MDVMSLVAKLTLDTSGFSSDLTSAESEMKGTGSRLGAKTVAIGNTIAHLAQQAAKAVVGMAKQTVKVGMDFDSAMSQVKALGQLENDEFVQVRQKAMQLGESTKFTAAQVAEAFSYMALAGWDTEEMLAGIDGVLNLAAASGEDLGRTSDIVTDAITAMGLTAEDAGHFVDVLAAASANSNTTVAQMGEAFKYLATTGGVMQYSIEDIATTLGLLANNGIKASQAGTSMRQILNTLINPTEKAAEAMGELGISLFESGTNARKPLGQLLTEFRDVFKDAGLQMKEGFSREEITQRIAELDEWYDQQYTKLQEDIAFGKIFGSDDHSKLFSNLNDTYQEKLADLFGINQNFLAKLGDIGGLRGISSLFAIMASTDKDFDQLTQSIENSEGAAKEMADTMLDNLTGDITILNSALEGLQIVVSDAFKEDLRSFIQMLTGQIGELNEAFEANGTLGMFTNLANWLIGGITDSLSNPSEQNVTDFGEAIGTFIGTTVAKLVTNLPDMIAGIITIGESLAGGLIEGLFKGLFGDNSETQQLVDGLEKTLSGVEVDNVKAQGLLSYLEELAAAGDENVTKTAEWQSAVEQLEAIMPGVKDQLEAEGATLQSNIEKVRQMTDEFRKQAIHQAMVNTLQKQYEHLADQQFNLEKAKINASVAQQEQQAVRDTLMQNISKYANFLLEGLQNGTILDVGQGENYRMFAEGKFWNGEEYADLSQLDFEGLKSYLEQLMQAAGGEEPWTEDQNYLSPKDLEALAEEYGAAATALSDANGAIVNAVAEIEATRANITTTEAAVRTVAEELTGTAGSIGPAGDSVVNALNGLANRIAGSSPMPLYTHAKGLNTVPYDNYVARLHRGERVLTRTQARQYREGNSDVDLGSAMGQITAAIKDGMAGATVQSFLNGKDITRAVSKELGNQMKARRFSS